MCSSWSTRICFVSKSSRPISVDLPSSTEPAVTRRRSSVSRSSLEVANAFPVFHRGLADAVVGAGLAALGDVRCRDLVHDLVDRRRVAYNTAGARHVADRAEADVRAERLLVREALDELRDGVEHPVAAEHVALVREVDLRELEILARDVLPDVELGPVRDREHTDVLALADARVVEVPQLGALCARVPLAEVVAEAEDALLRARPLLVAARAAHRGVEAVRLDRIEERRRLQLVARRARSRLLLYAALVDRLLHARDDEPLAEFRDAAVAELDHLGEVVTGVDVHDGKRELRGTERLLREPQQHDRVLAAREEKHRTLSLRGDLPHDVDRLRLELVEMRQRPAVGARALRCTSSGTRRSSASRARTLAADSAGVAPVVSRRSSGCCGASYGAETPVKSSISPANARAYSPFGSRRAHSSIGVATCTSTNGECGSTSARARRRASSYGEIADTITAAPARATREATQA